MFKRKLFGSLVVIGGVIALAMAALFTSPASAASSMQNGRVAFIGFNYDAGHYDLYSVASDGSDKKSIVSGSADVSLSDPQFSPNGKTIAYGSTDWTSDPNQGYIVLADTDGSNPRNIVDLGGGTIGGLSWSPDGTQLAYIALAAVTFEPSIHIVQAGGTGDQTVNIQDLDGSSIVRSIAWSSDNKLAYVMDGHLLTADVDGTNVADLTDDSDWTGASVSSANWSPDGTKIVFTAFDCPGSVGCVATTSSDGTDKHIVIQDADANTPCDVPIYQYAQWSPDGTRILFAKALMCA